MYVVVFYEFFEDILVEFVVKCVYDIYCVIIFKEIIDDLVKVVFFFGKSEVDCYMLCVIIIVF